MPRGGARDGAGRPEGTENEDTRVRRRLKEKWLKGVDSFADEIFEAHRAAALGHYEERVMPDGTVRVYKRRPNFIALQWMMEHVWGLAPMKLDLNADVEVRHILSVEAQLQVKRAIALASPDYIIDANDPIAIRANAKEAGQSRDTLQSGDARPAISQGSGI